MGAPPSPRPPALSGEPAAEPARYRIKQGIPLDLLSDIRTVSVIFINMPDMPTRDESMLGAFQMACSVCERALSYYKGTMRQFLQEDKGVTCIGEVKSRENAFFILTIVQAALACLAKHSATMLLVR